MVAKRAVIYQHIIERPREVPVVATAHVVLTTQTSGRGGIEIDTLTAVAEVGTELHLIHQTLHGFENLSEINLAVETSKSTEHFAVIV